MKTVEERFWSKVDKTSSSVYYKGTRCWEWTGAKNSSKYGCVRIKKKKYYVHRVSYKMKYGPIPKNMCICHHCNIRLCVNPEHLFIGTHTDNMKDASKKERLGKIKGSEIVQAKLTEAQIPAIRKDPRSEKYIARDYGVSKSNIGFIKRRHTWKHVK